MQLLLPAVKSSVVCHRFQWCCSARHGAIPKTLYRPRIPHQELRRKTTRIRGRLGLNMHD